MGLGNAMSRFIICVVVSLFAVSFQTRGDDDPVRAKLEQAKIDYEKSLSQYRELVKEYFDKMEATARIQGSKRSVDQIKAERETFEKSGELPKTAPVTLRTRPAIALANLTEAYTQ